MKIIVWQSHQIQFNIGKHNDDEKYEIDDCCDDNDNQNW